MPIDRAAPVTFLRTAFHEDDWVAVFLKSYQSGRVAQRVRPVQQIQSAKFQAWLRAENAAGANVYVSVNTLAPYQRSRRRDSVREIRHVFLDADSAAQEVLDAIETATALPSPSYVMRSSPGRAHLFWRVSRFTSDTVEALERHLARKLGTDPAATACTQVTRLPGFVNHKRATPYLISIEYGDTNRCTNRRIFRSRPRGSCRHPYPWSSLPVGTLSFERVSTSQLYRPQSPDSMETSTRSAFVVASSGASRWRTTKHSTCCASGTAAASRPGPIVNSWKSYRGHTATAASRLAVCSRSDRDGRTELRRRVRATRPVRFTLFACVHIDPCERNRRRRPRASASSEDVCPSTQANSCP